MYMKYDKQIAILILILLWLRTPRYYSSRKLFTIQVNKTFDVSSFKDEISPLSMWLSVIYVIDKAQRGFFISPYKIPYFQIECIHNRHNLVESNITLPVIGLRSVNMTHRWLFECLHVCACDCVCMCRCVGVCVEFFSLFESRRVKVIKEGKRNGKFRAKKVGKIYSCTISIRINAHIHNYNSFCIG